jgi:hypothetical protein
MKIGSGIQNNREVFLDTQTTWRSRKPALVMWIKNSVAPTDVFKEDGPGVNTEETKYMMI